MLSGVKSFAANEVPEVVDLGLTSQTLWAAWNIGASSPEEYGYYFAWGETAPKSYYDWSTYKFGGASNFTKYNSTDGLIQLELEDDAAYVILGKDWRMPTHEQEVELVNECSWEDVTINGVRGYKITGPNGNSIFMPRGGLYDGTVYTSYANTGGWYWTSTLNSVGSSYAQGLYFLYIPDYSYLVNTDNHERCDGHNIRPVYVGKTQNDNASLKGKGTWDNPYLIGSAAELKKFNELLENDNSLCARLTADIVLNENVLDENYNLNGDGSNFEQWMPHNIDGYFNGAGHTISGLYINNSKEYQALFSASARIDSLGLIDSYIKARRHAGGLSAWLIHRGNVSGQISSCYFDGVVIATSDKAGGITAHMGNTYERGLSNKIINCYNKGKISGYNHVGGICGSAYSLTNYNEDYIENCYNVGFVSASSTDCGAICGYADNAVGTKVSSSASGCYYLEGTCTKKGQGYMGTSKTLDSFKNGSVCALLNNNGGKFKQTIGKDLYPILFEEALDGINLIDKMPYTIEESTDVYPYINYIRTFGNTNWQALYIPFSMSYSDWKDDFEVAYINGIRQLDRNDDGVIDETIMDIVKIKKGNLLPNTPYLIKAKTTGEKTLSVNNTTLYEAKENSIDCRTTIAEYTFTGTYSTISAATLIENNYYTMDGGALVMSDGDNDLMPYRWYMKMESRNPMYNMENAAKMITINVIGEEEEETTTGISQKQMPIEKSFIYDLNGRKVNENNMQPGVYIKNGKKYAK